jgi:Ca2+-binding EF-hand superfamily protein
MCRHVLLLLAALLGVSWLAVAADKPPAAERAPAVLPQDEQDLIFFHPARPLLLRLHVQVHRQPFQTQWTEAVRNLFHYLDADGDGVLSRQELLHAPSPHQLQQQLAGAAGLEPDPAPEFAEVDRAPADGRVTLDELVAYYRRHDVGPLQVEMTRGDGVADQMNRTLFDYLDRNQDGKLSREELLDAPAALRVLDVNEDEVITPDELFGAPARPRLGGGAGTNQVQPAADSGPIPFLLLQPGGDERLARRLLERYDRNKDGKLSRAEVGLEQDVFNRLDTNHDGQLDAAELAEWVGLPPDVEVLVQLGEGRGKGGSATLLSPEERARPLVSALRPQRTGILLIALRDVQVELLPDDAVEADRPRARAELQQRFRALDANGDGYLDSKELYHEPFDLVPLLRLADRDGDGKVSRQEFAAYLDLQEKALAASTVLSVTDRGRRLFELLDADHDGRLGPRELRAAWARLAPWDRDGDGAVSAAEVPQQYQLTLSQGPLRLGSQGSLPSFRGQGPRIDRRRGPLWFRKMDRNRDGDVSRREFLGSDEDFRRIDTDGDGLIDTDEAERADTWFRKKMAPGR